MPKTYYDSELSGEQIESALEAIHGVVTPSNNGKVLCIVNGVIAAKSASEWGHGAVLEPLSVTANGDYTPPTGTDGFNSVNVAVPSSTLITKNITSNGTYSASQDDADGYSSVTVAVPGGATIEPLEVTENGTYTPPSGVDGFAPVTVNVSGRASNILYGAEGPSSSEGDNGDIFLRTISSMDAVLPSGYQELPAIEGTGTQYIDTSISTAQVGLSVKAKIAITGVNSTSSSSGDGIWGGSWDTNGYLMIRYGNSPGVFRWHYGGKVSSDVHVTLNKWISLETNGTGMIIDGVTYPAAGGANAQNTLSLFFVGTHPAGYYPSKMRLSRTKVSVDNTILADFVPCKNSNNEIGMYDIIGQSFYGNSGNGTFLAVTENTITSAFLKVNGSWQDLIGSNINDVNR